jgi:outer membrane protein assembly factor BamB
VAYDLTEATLEERLIGEAPEHRRNDRYPDGTKGNFRPLWKLPFDLRVHIKAGRRLYATSEHAVVAIDIPDQDGGPLQVASWIDIGGTPQRMLAADGKLFVVTREGHIYAFSGQGNAKAIIHRKPAPAFVAADDWTEKTATILRATGVHDGYALVNGVGTGRLAEELVRQSSCHVIVVDDDAEKVALLRDKFQPTGQYGTRIVAHHGDPMSFPLPPYLANLVVSEEPITKVDPTSVEALFHVLRPYGGTACLEVAEAQRDTFSQAVSAAELFGSEVRWTSDTVLLSRRGSLPDSADWSHRGADAANSGASQERSLTAPLGVLWFDGSLRWNRQPGYAAVRVCGGRVFVHAERLYAVDVFTGRHLWQVALPSLVGQGSDFVAVEDGVFVTSHRTILILDPATGQVSRQMTLPGDLPQPWSDVRVLDQYLVGTSGKQLICMNHRSGELMWKYECGRANLNIALGDGAVFCAELINKRRGESEDDGKTRAFDIATGELLWEVASGSEIRYSEPHDLLVTANGVYSGSDGIQVRSGGSSAAIVGDRLVVGDHENFAMHDLLSGAPLGDELNWSRRGCTSLRASWSLLTTRFHGNAAFIDLASRNITSLWGVRSACSNNLFPADGVLNVPNLTGGCTCNYTPASQAFVPAAAIGRTPREPNP